jgi:Ni,Fe-hydrogenase I small subunit
MSDEQDSLKDNKISRRQFIKLVGAGTLFIGLGAFGIPNLLKSYVYREMRILCKM